jgi:hypothetical protein
MNFDQHIMRDEIYVYFFMHKKFLIDFFYDFLEFIFDESITSHLITLENILLLKKLLLLLECRDEF